ncbi:MAG: cellulase family glycosylhydrolase, partial [Chitinophagaceae bacterium]
MKVILSLIFVCTILIASGQSKNAYIRISPRDHRYLEYSDGKPYIPIGLNLIGMGRFGTDSGFVQIENLLQKLSKNKGNYFRIWLSDKFFDIEHTKSGKYDEVKAERLDKVIQMAAKYNLHIKGTIEHFRHFNKEPAWSAKALHDIKNGGTATSIKDFFIGNASKELYKRKLDWYAKRYASDPTIYTWELWNEVNTVQGGG